MKVIWFPALSFFETFFIIVLVVLLYYYCITSCIRPNLGPFWSLLGPFLASSEVPKVPNFCYYMSGSPANVSETKWAVKKWNSKWSTTANPLLNKRIVNFNPLAKKFCCLIPTHWKSALRPVSNNFTFWLVIFLQRIDITKIGIASDQLQPFWCWAKTIWWTLFH